MASGEDRPSGAVSSLFGPRHRDRRDAAAGICPAMAADRGAVAFGDDVAGSAHGLPGLGLVRSSSANNNSVPWTIIFVLTLLTLMPALLLSMTPMVRLLVVFHFLRQALGTQTAPSNQVLMGLGLMMTWFLMHPVLLQVDQQAVEPFRAGRFRHPGH